jgi:class 3 adenylate cyclase
VSETRKNPDTAVHSLHLDVRTVCDMFGDAAFLYADLAGSSNIAKHCAWSTAAKIIRAYLECATRLMRAYGGHVRSFDGDRVMAVFIGDTKCSDATNCAREIHWVTSKIVQRKAHE